METTICPWCQTEIVWDEELGAEEHCPYCHNELKGYRTLNITLGEDEEDEEDEADEETNEAEGSYFGFWEDNENHHIHAIRRAETFASAGGDLLAYESSVEKILDQQEDVPECPHCREYMMFAGVEKLAGEFEPSVPEGLKDPLLKKTSKLNVYICTACFHVGRFLSEDDRNGFIRTISENKI